MKRSRGAGQFIGVLLLAFCFMLALVGVAGAEPADHAWYQQLRERNKGKLATPLRFIPTTEQAVVYTFGGLSKAQPLQDVLDRLDAYQMRGTFFVSERELQRNADHVAMIAAHGQELAIGLRAEKTDGYYDFCAQIDRIRQTLRERYGVEANYVRLIMGPDSDELKEAVSAMGCILFSQGLNMVQSKDKEAQTTDEVMKNIFGKWTTSLGRGEVVYIRTDFYTKDTLAGDIMIEVKEKKIDNIAYRTYDDTPETNPENDSAYRVASLGDVMAARDKLYAYPVNPAAIPAELRPGYQSFSVTNANFDEVFWQRYLGSPLVDSADRMLGFSREEMQKADKTGIVKTVTDNTIFLTFDDWGNDDSINKLLYVLRKHHVTGTFFVITWNMPNNPNLLRAMAADGNGIGSHTNGHKAMAVRDAHNRQVPVLSDLDYAIDVRQAYEKLASVVGDVEVDGHYSLTRLLRPPTLAISRAGARSIFDAGYTYIVSGYESTEDYAQPSLQSLVTSMQHGVFDSRGRVRKGTVLVMHMSETAGFTPRALDILLTVNEQRAADDPAKFKVGRLSDYLTGNYSQRRAVKKE
jgi:peptidoglycan/xylan/chitin deacetylase (PgdA/CDA1 family)